MSKISKILFTSHLLGILCFVDYAFAYSAPVESRSHDQQYESNNINSDAEFVAIPPDNSLYGNSNDAPRQQAVSGERLNQPDAFSQLQRMEQELRELRGQLEVQEHTIKRLQETQRNQYQDLEQRFLSNSSKTDPVAKIGRDEAITSKKNNENITLKEKPPIQKIKTPPNVAADKVKNNPVEQYDETAKKEKTLPGIDESGLYQQAYNFLKSKQYSQAIPAMHVYLKQYPKGEYAVNAHYWLGELNLLIGNSAEAKNQFQIVVDEFPKSVKVSDALLKIGNIEADNGQHQDARKKLTKVTKDYPNTPAARLAEQRLQQIALEGN